MTTFEVGDVVYHISIGRHIEGVITRIPNTLGSKDTAMVQFDKEAVSWHEQSAYMCNLRLLRKIVKELPYDPKQQPDQEDDI